MQTFYERNNAELRCFRFKELVIAIVFLANSRSLVASSKLSEIIWDYNCNFGFEFGQVSFS